MSDRDKLNYALVATTNGDFVADYPTNMSKMKSMILQKILPKLPKESHFRVITMEGKKLLYKCNGIHFYFVVADDIVPIRVGTKFLELIDRQHIVVNDVQTLLKDQLAACNDPNNDQISSLQTKMNSLREGMLVNIDKVIDRGENIEELNRATEEIKYGSVDFERGTNKIKWSMRKQYAIVLSILFGVLAALALLILFVACGITFQKCKSSSSSH
ncbi:vesicle-associated membrane protein [Acrasis kona]|uniref:Vesicle-associated membrane protein n=1 Tax=Acrasis kona TaxID=1008807 RepID=A0AAW2ZC38_9EUKA